MKGSIGVSKYNNADIKQRLSSTELAVTALNGGVAGSVEKQIDDAFNDSVAKMSDGSVINTYKELIDYCSTHSAEAAKMEGDIATNKRAISTLETFIGKLPNGTDTSTVIEYINAKIGNEIASIPSALDLYKVSNNAAVSENASAISALQEKVEALESVEFIPKTVEQINGLFESSNTSSD